MTPRGSVLVTGTSTGIGRATVRALAADGFTVFAGARRSESVDDLAREKGDVRPLLLDVADPESIAAARAHIDSELGGLRLRAIVNNAGVSFPGPLELIDIAEVEHMLRVNLLGSLSVCQAFLPLLEQPGGRIINIGSGEGFVVLPINGAYAISKHGVEALSRALRLELGPSDRYVSVVVPGTVTTPMLHRALAQYDDLLNQDGGAPYRSQISGRRRLTARGVNASGPYRTALTITKAIAAPRPRHHYYVGWAARIPAVLSRLPTRLGDLLLRQAVR